METRTPEMQKRGLTMGKAILKLSMYVNSGMLTVSVLKARHIFSRYTHNSQPYVQVCLSPDPSGGTNCYTAVSQGAPHPTFNEKFSFDVIHCSETLPGDGRRRVHISVWNSSGSPGGTAEFLGSMSFGLQHLLNKPKETSGWYYLLREDVGRRKHLPALMRSDIYQECGTISEETPLMPRKQHIQVTDVIVHRDFNADTLHKPFDSVGLQRPQILIHNTKQVRFDVNAAMSNYSASNIEKTMSGQYPSSNNPYIQQYRREISALTTRTPQHNVDYSVLTGNSSLLLSSVSRQLHDDFALNPLNSDTECPTTQPQHTNKCRRASSFNDAVTSPRTNKHNSLTNRKLFQETSFNTRDSSERPKEEDHLNREQKSDIWVDCRQKKSIIETEHDSGICDSLSPSPKSDALTCCNCCRNSDRKYVDLVDTSINSDEPALDRSHSINNNEPAYGRYHSVNNNEPAYDRYHSVNNNEPALDRSHSINNNEPTHERYTSRYTQYSPDSKEGKNIANMENCYNYNNELCSDIRDHVINKCSHCIHSNCSQGNSGHCNSSYSNCSHGNSAHCNCSHGISSHGNYSHGNHMHGEGCNVEVCVHDQTSPLMSPQPCCHCCALQSESTRHTSAHNTQSHQTAHYEHSAGVPPTHKTHQNTLQHRPFYPRHGRHFDVDSMVEKGLSEFSTMNCVDHRDAWHDNTYDTGRPHGKHKANKRYTNQLQSDNRDHKASIHTKVYFL